MATSVKSRCRSDSGYTGLATLKYIPRVKQVVTEDSIAHYCSRPSSRGLNDRSGR